MNKSNRRGNRRSLAALRGKFFGSERVSGARRGSKPIRVETLEARLLLASDIGIDPLLPGDAVTVGPDRPAENGLISTYSESPAEGENTPAPDLVAFAKALAQTEGVTMFAAAWCPACNAQKALFEDGADFLPFVEVTNPDRTLNDIGIAENIQAFPTWEFPDGSREQGVLSLETIASRAGVAIPTGVDPSVAPIADTTVLDGSPLLVALNGYDPNGGTLTFTVESSNPSIVQPTVLTGNPSARVTVSGWGDMVFQLFENQVPRAAGRFIELAQSGFYDAANHSSPITIHRVIDNFVMQFGDPTGTGSGGSTLGDFDDQFNPDLQHNSAGILSWAKSTDDTNDSQVFVTDVPTRYLDFNHSVFGKLTEGDKVRDAITATATDSSNKPRIPINIESVSIFNDAENGIVMLKAVEGATGTADITVTVTDEDGNQSVETFTVTVAPDTYNGGPYLNDIPTIQATVGSPATFQLSAVDVEGDPVQFDGVKSGTVDYTFSVNSQTGDVVVTPPAGYVGTMQLLVRVRPAGSSDTNDLYDSQLVDIVVAPAAPTGVDLLASSDSGAHNDDNLTRATSLSFQVSGVTSGAVVRLHSGQSVIGQTTASGTTATITTSSLASVADGTYNIFATQLVNGIESPVSASLDVTIDRTAPPVFSSTPPTTAVLGQLLTYDAENSEEGAADTLYSLAGAPSGVAIDPADGQMTWTPGSADLGGHSFSIVITDAAGNTRSQDVSIDVITDSTVLFRLEIVDAGDNPITRIDVGGLFQVNVYVEDLRAQPEGVWAAFLDIMYNQQLVAITGPLSYGPEYPNQPIGDVSTPGLVNEAGALAGLTPLGGGEFLLLSVPMRATNAGTATFESDPADNQPSNEILLFGLDEPVPVDDVAYGSTVLTVEPAFDANDDLFNVDEDSAATSLDLLDNDEVFEGSPGNLVIVNVTTPTQGGTVQIATDGLSVDYSPEPNFFGEDTFFYTVSDGTGTKQAQVTVQVAPVNDDPVAVDDAFTVGEDAVNFSLNVLANDLITPDVGETLSVISFSGLSAGGTLTIPAEKDRLLYTPAANYNGTETFTYTISDGNGGTSEATVTVTITEANDPPAAQDDLLQVEEDSTDNVLDVLANDSTMGDPNETLTIIDVTTPEHGGSVSIATDGLSLLYSPVPDFFGTERFTYTISDGNGGTAQASVVVAVNNTNDPPTANDDALTVVKDTVNNVLDVLANDSSDPDATEELTIVSVDNVSANATVTISADGKHVNYTPVAGFTGEDTFSYTIEDPDGATAEATATVTVQDFIPSKMSGYVYVDVNNNGVKDAKESPLGGIVVKLVGTDLYGASVEQQQTTDALGFYEFVDLAPGTYSLMESHPKFLIDGIDSAGTFGSSVGTDELLIELEQDTDATNLNFGERGRESKNISLFDFFVSTPRESLLVTAGLNAEEQWYAVEGGWTAAKSMNVALDSGQQSAQLNLVTAAAESYSATLDFYDQKLVLPLGSIGTMQLMRVVGSQAMLFPDVDCGCTDGEGESPAVTPPTGGAEGEAGIAQPALFTAATDDARAPSVLPEAALGGEGELATLTPLSWSLTTDEAAVAPEGRTAPAEVLMAATPADAYLATDLLMAEPAGSQIADDAVDVSLTTAAQTGDDYRPLVDEALLQLLDESSRD